MAQCKVCGGIFKAPNGKTSTCRSCEEAGYKYCNRCGKILPIEEFHIYGKRVDGSTKYYGHCIQCHRNITTTEEATKRHTQESRRRYNNDEEVRKRRLHSNRNNAYVRRGAEGTHTIDEWINTLELFGHKCCYCGSDKNLTKDHVVPLSKGGTNYIENILPACRSCNSSKGTKELIEWYTSQPFYSKDRLSNIIKYLRAKGGDANAKQD